MFPNDLDVFFSACPVDHMKLQCHLGTSTSYSNINKILCFERRRSFIYPHVGGSRSKTDPIRAFHHFSFPSCTTIPALIFFAHRFRKDAKKTKPLYNAPTTHAPSSFLFIRPTAIAKIHQTLTNVQNGLPCPRIGSSPTTSRHRTMNHASRFHPSISAWLVFLWAKRFEFLSSTKSATLHGAIILAHQKAEKSCCATSLTAARAHVATTEPQSLSSDDVIDALVNIFNAQLL